MLFVIIRRFLNKYNMVIDATIGFNIVFVLAKLRNCMTKGLEWQDLIECHSVKHFDECITQSQRLFSCAATQHLTMCVLPGKCLVEPNSCVYFFLLRLVSISLS
jgi:hypothetical protein